jgi:hypothetical protein
MTRPCTLLDVALGTLGLLILAALAAIGFVAGSQAVPAGVKWAASVGLIGALGLFSFLAAWLAFRRENAWVRTLCAVWPQEEALSDSLPL